MLLPKIKVFLLVALLALPITTEPSPDALLFTPTAILPVVPAVEPVPKAKLFSPKAWVLLPMATEFLPEALAILVSSPPMATAPILVA